MTQLIEAVRRGDLPGAEAVLEEDPRAVGRGDAQGMTPLMWAAWLGHTALVRWLLVRGAPTQARDIRGASALTLAAERGHLDAARLLMPTSDGEERGEALRHAVGAGRVEMALWLLDEAGAALEYAGMDGRTPLVCATIGGHAAMAAELLRRGAHVEARSTTFLPLENRAESGWHPLHFAADRRQALLMQLLLEAGAEVDAVTDEGTTPLMLAASRGDEDSVVLLLLAGAQPHQQNARQESALSLSRRLGKPHVTLLLERPIGDEEP